MNWQELKLAPLEEILAWADSQPWCQAMADCDQDIEPPFERLLRQNRNRRNAVPEQVVKKLAAKCEPPTWSEGHGLLMIDGEDQ